MHFSTHIRIGNYLYAILTPEQKEVIDKNVFVFGNISPDLIRKGTKDQHIFTKTRHIMIDIINRLTNRSNRKTTGISEKTILLGSLCHHVSDIFCRYHHDPKLYSNLRYHYQYEVGLHRHFMWLIDEKKIDPLLERNQYDCLKQAIQFMVFKNNFRTNDFIEQLATEVESYSMEEPNYDLDIRYSLSNCNRVLETFLPFVGKVSFDQIPQMQIPQIHIPETESIFWRDAI